MAPSLELVGRYLHVPVKQSASQTYKPQQVLSDEDTLVEDNYLWNDRVLRMFARVTVVLWLRSEPLVHTELSITDLQSIFRGLSCFPNLVLVQLTFFPSTSE